MLRKILLATLAAVPMLAWAGMYKWSDAQGRVHYSDQRPPEGAQSLAIAGRVSGYTPVAIAPLEPAETGPIAAAGDVLMFTTSRCPYCAKAKAYLNAKGIAFRELDIEGSETNRSLFVRAGGKGVPHTVINRGGREITLRGFSEAAFEGAFGGR